MKNQICVACFFFPFCGKRKTEFRKNVAFAFLLEDNGFLPDQLINPREYKPVLPTTEEHTAVEPTVRKGAINEEARRRVHLWLFECCNTLVKIIICYVVSEI